jgi:hypothetical protein
MSAITLKSAPKELFAGLGVDTKTTTTIQIPIHFLEAIKTASRKTKEGDRKVVFMAMPLDRLMECIVEADPEDALPIPEAFSIAKPLKAPKEKKPRAPKAPKEGVEEVVEEVLTEEQLRALYSKGIKAGAHLKTLAAELSAVGVSEEQHKQARKHWSQWRSAHPEPAVEDVLSLDQMEELRSKGHSASAQTRKMKEDLNAMGIPEESHKQARDEYVKWAQEQGVPTRKEAAKSPKASPKAPVEAPVEVKEEPEAEAEVEVEEIVEEVVVVPLPAPETPKAKKAAAPKTPKATTPKTPAAPKKASKKAPVPAPVEDDAEDLADLIEE